MNLGYKRYLDFFFLFFYEDASPLRWQIVRIQNYNYLIAYVIENILLAKSMLGFATFCRWLTWSLSNSLTQKLKEFIIEKIQAWFQGGLSSYMYLSLSCWGFHPPV